MQRPKNSDLVNTNKDKSNNPETMNVLVQMNM